MIVRGEFEPFIEKFLKASGESRAILLVGNREETDKFSDLMSKFIFCKSKNNCGACQSCKLKINPDLYRYTEINLKIEDAREIVAHSVQSSWNKVKLLIINITQASADVQTTLLKTLEDLRSNVFFILASEEKDHLIPPLLSRLTTIQLPILRTEVNQEYQKLLGRKSLKEKLDSLNLISKDRERAGNLLRTFEFHLEDKLFLKAENDYLKLADLISYFFEIKKRFVQKTYYNKMLLENLIIADSISI